jgi:hypothetical protein
VRGHVGLTLTCELKTVEVVGSFTEKDIFFKKILLTATVHRLRRPRAAYRRHRVCGLCAGRDGGIATAGGRDAPHLARVERGEQRVGVQLGEGEVEDQVKACGLFFLKLLFVCKKEKEKKNGAGEWAVSRRWVVGELAYGGEEENEVSDGAYCCDHSRLDCHCEMLELG